MNKKRVIGIILILIILFNLYGCKVALVNHDRKGNYGGIENDNKIKNNDIDKITIWISPHNDDENKFARQISIVADEKKIECEYMSEYLDEPLTANINQDDYDKICKSIDNFASMGWKTENIEKYDTSSYRTKDIQLNKIKIESSKYAIETKSDVDNLCTAIVCQICNTIMPIDKWETKAKIDLNQYFHVEVTFAEYVPDGKGSILDGKMNQFLRMYYVASPNYFNLNDEMRAYKYSSFDKNQRYMELAIRTSDNAFVREYNSLTMARPFEFEYYTLLSKFDLEKIKNNSVKPKEDSEGNIIEPVYVFKFVDREEKKIAYYVNAEKMKEINQVDMFEKMYYWHTELASQFRLIL